MVAWKGGHSDSSRQCRVLSRVRHQTRVSSHTGSLLILSESIIEARGTDTLYHTALTDCPYVRSFYLQTNAKNI